MKYEVSKELAQRRLTRVSEIDPDKLVCWICRWQYDFHLQDEVGADVLQFVINSPEGETISRFIGVFSGSSSLPTKDSWLDIPTTTCARCSHRICTEHITNDTCLHCGTSAGQIVLELELFEFPTGLPKVSKKTDRKTKARHKAMLEKARRIRKHRVDRVHENVLALVESMRFHPAFELDHQETIEDGVFTRTRINYRFTTMGHALE